MAGISLQIGNVVLLVAILFVVIGLVLAAVVFFKRNCDLTDDDRLHYKRAILLWTGASAVALVAIYSASAEKTYRKGLGLSASVSTNGRSASLL